MESLKTFLADSKGYIQRIVGLADWRTAPSMSLEQVTTQTRAILGKTDQFATPDIHLADASSQIAAIIGEGNDMAVPDISLATTSSQVIAITGKPANNTAPDISLATTKTHVDTTPTTGTAHGITGWSTAPVALGAAAAGTATTIARSDHVHPTTGLLTTSTALTSSQLGGVPVALGSANAAGTSTTAAKSDHVHIYPTAANVGAMATTHAANSITALGGTPAALGTASSGSGTAVALSNHVHTLPSLATLGAAPAGSYMTTSHAANNITGFGVYPSALGTSSGGTSTNVARIDHVHALPTLAALGASAAGTYDRALGNMTGATVFSNIYVTNGLMTGVVSRSLTPADIGAQPASDYRVKHMVSDIPSGSLERIEQLRVIGYRFRDIDRFTDDGMMREGFIAHELQEVIPAGVLGEKDGLKEDGGMEVQYLDLAPIVAVLTAALQELSATVRDLRARIDSLGG